MRRGGGTQTFPRPGLIGVTKRDGERMEGRLSSRTNRHHSADLDHEAGQGRRIERRGSGRALTVAMQRGRESRDSRPFCVQSVSIASAGSGAGSTGITFTMNGLFYDVEPEQVIVLFSAYLNADLVAQAKRLGVAGCVPKKDVRQLPGIIKDIVAARA